MKRNSLYLILATALLLSCGCNNRQRFKYNYKTAQRHITITTSPSDASVFQKSFINNMWISLGKTPLSGVPVSVLTSAKFKNAPPSKVHKTYQQLNSVIVRIEKDGFESYSGPLRTDPDEIVRHHVKLSPKAE